MLRVGLTGGIATGKSHVRRRFEAAGLATLDLDQITHELLAAGAQGQRAVVETFGAGLLASDGSIDRRALGALVFREPAARALLNARLHPLIRRASEARAEALFAAGALVVVSEAALLVETGAHLLRFDRLVVVHCPAALQLERLMARDGIAREAAEARLCAQMPVERKRLFAHRCVDSSGERARTDELADELADELRELSRRPPVRVDVDSRAALGCLQRGPQAGPRGLTPRRLVETMAAQSGLDLQACAGALDPPHDGPWYQAATTSLGGPGPEALAGPVALWSLARRGADEVFLAGAAAALARLTHDDAASVTRAVTAAGCIYDAALAGAAVARDLHWQALAAGFGGVPAALTSAALRDLDAALRGLREGPDATADQALVDDLARLAATSR